MTTSKLMRDEWGDVVGDDGFIFRLRGVALCGDSDSKSNTEEMIKRYNQHEELVKKVERLKHVMKNLIETKDIVLGFDSEWLNAALKEIE